MKRDRVFVGEMADGLITDASAVAHIAKSLRLKPGDEFAGYDGRRELALRLKAVGRDSAETEIISEREILPASKSEIVLAAALTKAARWEWMLEKAVELGISAALPVMSERCEVKWKREQPGRDRTVERWNRIMRSAVAQSAGRMPELMEPVSFEGLLSFVTCENKYILAEGGGPLAEAVGGAAPGKILLAVGPEGGWTPEELRAAREAGFISASLGPTILRSETAALAAVAVAASAAGYNG